MRFARALSVVSVVVALIGATLTAASAQGGKPEAADVGITDDEIRVAMIADVENPAVPGLFQPSVDVVRAWAKNLNKKGGIADRKVVVDFIDSKLSADEARALFVRARPPADRSPEVRSPLRKRGPPPPESARP